MENENACPKCKTGEIVVYTKPDGNYIGCNSCNYRITMTYTAKSSAKRSTSKVKQN